MKYAVLGAAGQLGRDLCRRLPGQVMSLNRKDLDFNRHESFDKLSQLRPDVVINCAAYNLVDRAESEPEAAFAVNTWGVRRLAQICEPLDCSLVHFSTDYVFGLDSRHAAPYTEADAPGPMNVYGLSKLAGEYQVRALCSRHLVIRTCGLYGVWGQGGKGRNFVETMLRLAGEGKALRVVDDQLCTPSYTADIAEATAALMKTGTHGLVHLTNAGECSWYEFTLEILRQQGVQADVTPISSEEYGAAARRPPYSVMQTNRSDLSEALMLRPWQEALGCYLKERQSHRG